MSDQPDQPPAPPHDSKGSSDPLIPSSSLLGNLVFGEPDSPANLLREPLEPQNLKAGNFAKIIEHLTHPTVHDATFLDDFVLTYRSFAAPVQVFEALILRYDTAPKDVKQAVGIRVFNVIEYWIENAFYDFDKDDALSERCLSCLEHYISSDDPLKDIVIGIKTTMTRKKNGTEETVSKAGTKPPPTLLGPKDNELSNLMDLNSEEIARQLTIIEWTILARIQPCELIGLKWTKPDKEITAPNVLDLVNRFNVVSGWVETTILTLEDIKKRKKAIGKFLEIACHLRSMGNLNGVMEVVSALRRSPVYGLKQTWARLSSKQKKTFEELEELVDSAKSFANLRKAMKTLNPPCIPYFGFYLTTLCFIEEGNFDHEGDLIYWRKRHLLADTIREIKQYQRTPYPFTPVPWLQINLNTRLQLNDRESHMLRSWLEGATRSGQDRPQILVQAQEAQERAAAAYAASLKAVASSSGASR